MSGLAKARLSEVRSTPGAETIGEPLEVQFNPESLKLTISNAVEGGGRSGRQARQYIGSSSTELSFDLVFDTAEEVSADGTHRSVRERTSMVERFLRPKGQGGGKQTVPKVRFHWGDLVVDGVIEALAVDFELFSSGGVPLRAKMRVTIKEQDSKYQYLESGPGANRQVAPAAGGGGGVPGGGGAGGLPGGSGEPGGSVGGARAAEALAGEGLVDLAVRHGLDPAAWRSMAPGITDPASLVGGAQLRVPGGGGRGGALGAASTAPLRIEPEDGRAGGLAAATATGLDGRALVAEGGVAAASAARVAAEAARAAAQEAGAFGGGAGGGGNDRRSPAAVPMRAGAGGGRGAGSALAASDSRGASFGYGVPLRARIGGAVEERRLLLSGAISIRRREVAPSVPDPTVAPWVRLPAYDTPRRGADQAQATVVPRHPCGCGGRGPTKGGAGCRCR